MASFELGEVLFGREKGSGGWLPPSMVRFVRFVYLVVQDFNLNRCPEKAAALGFETVLSFIPAVLLSLFFVHSIPGMENLSRDLPRRLLHELNIDQISLEIPASPASPLEAPSVVDVKLSDKIQDIVESADRSLRSSSVSLTSFIGLILTAVFLTLTLEHALNDIWAAHGRRGFVLKIAMSWSLLTLGPLLLGVSMYLTRALAAPAGFMDYVLRMLGPFFALYLLYKLVPAAQVSRSAALLGSGVAAAAWVAARKGFGYYLAYAVTIDKLYGALGLLPLLLIWIWVAWVIVLIGAEVAYTFQNLSRLTAKERRRRLAPFVQPGLMAVSLVLRAALSFRSGKGAVAGDELAEAAGLSDRLWLRLAALLVDRRILVAAGPDGQSFTLARPAEVVLVDEVFSAVEDALVARPEDSWVGETNPMKGLSVGLTAARRRELGAKSMAQLLDGSTRSA
jgi:YihY family inner membrane protein